MPVRLPRLITLKRPISVIAPIIGLFLLSMTEGCNLRDPSEPECANSDCYNMPRMAIGILQYDSTLKPCENVEITFKDSEGFVTTNKDAGPDADIYGCWGVKEGQNGLLWSACASSGPAVKWIDVTISQDKDRTTTQRIKLAEHNYCGEDIAYSLITLHKDGPPTFGEVMYVSPCKTGGL